MPISDLPTIEIIGDLQGKRAYTGYEVSGFIHLGSGITNGIQIKRLQEMGKEVVILLADWHSWINDKLGGDLKKIQEFMMKYFQPALEQSYRVCGVDTEKIIWRKTSEIMNDEYWATLLRISKRVNLSRIKRSITVLGRKESDSLDFAKFIYPVMQVTDQVILNAPVAFFGVDQRKTCVIARETVRIDGLKPSFVLHRLLLSLKGGNKMSKSIPGSAIFVHDTEEEIRRKIKKAYCMPRDVENNPVLQLATDILVPLGKMDDPTKAFKEGKLGPKELKDQVAEALVELLEPVRRWYSQIDIGEISITR